ncbi:MAG: glycerophosphodiester phosphodiesterase [Gemmatimonadota bacterium]|nr:glycerophosphodiester phosphodiesterase [Gemmatimonadota bacterium]
MNRFGFAGRAEIIAHRGFSARAPENTLAALSAAIEAGADAVEFDLQVTRDGVPVLFHDDSLDRTTDGTGTLADRSMDELRTLDAGSWFDPSFAGEPVPALAEALALLEAWPGRIYPELKDPTPLEHVDRIVAEVVSQDLLERTVFITMDWSLLERVRERAPKAGIGYIVRRASQTEEALVRAAGDPLALLDFDKAVALRDRDATGRARALGIPMAAWTVDDPDDATRLVDAGVERITTNRVDRMVAWKAEQAPG